MPQILKMLLGFHVNGIIEKGNYHGDMPIINIEEMNEVSPPDDDFVYSPSD